MKLLFILSTVFFLNHTSADNEYSGNEKWGQIGHYVTGEIAEYHLTDQAREKVNSILGDVTMARATVWMDDIRSDSRYDYTATWHWTTIPDGLTYEEAEQEATGDIISALETLIADLKVGELSETEERETLMLVMHMIGDIHQPLHVGTGADRGGNDVRLQWMGENSNLHRVWDSDIINSFQMSFTELARELNTATTEQIEEWQSTSVKDWAYESMSYRDRVYDLPDNMRLSYNYRYDNRDVIYRRLLQAGVRMAGVLNEIYGE